MQLKIPYGLSNFKDVATQHYTYIDKTNYIAELEQVGKHLVFLRPRRFGKSLFLSSLWYYYDIAYKDEFDSIFGHLSIGKNPTPLKSSYQVLFLEFSGISTESEAAIYRAFTTKIDLALRYNLKHYGYPETDIANIIAASSPHEKMEAFFNIVRGQKILLLIDEYDHFANSVLADNLQLFKGIVGKGGFVRSFYETLKTATMTGAIDRLFITGVTPMMLDSLTSGFNIGKNISQYEAFNSMVGFTKAEVETLFQPLLEQQGIDEATLMADIKRWYNGYRFHSEATETIYNANMVLYFLDNFDYKRCAYPKYMLDENIASDYGKILAMFNIGSRNENFAVLDELLNQGEVIAQQRRKFDFDKGFDRDDFISLLAYMGFVSLNGESLSGEVFVIPNHVIRVLYFQYFKVELERINQIHVPDRPILKAVEVLALRNDIQPLVQETAKVLQLLSNRDAMGMDEKHIKTLLLALLFQSPAYFIQSERELNRHYPDILLLERSPYKVNYQHLIELKYVKKSGKAAAWEAKRAEGIAQVQAYLQLPEIAALKQLSAWVFISDGEQLEAVAVDRA